MFKKLSLIGICLLILVLVIIIGKNVLVKAAVTAGVKAATGLNMSIKKMNIGFSNTLIGINDLKLYNPKGFEDPIMVDIPEVYVDYNLSAFFKKKVHLEEVRLHLKEFVVVKNKAGKLNLDSLTSIGAAKEGAESVEEKKDQPKKKTAMPEIKIDILKLKIDKVYYKDYSKGDAPSIKEYNVNIDAMYENITDPKALVNVIVLKALSDTAISSLTNFDSGSLADGLSGSVKGAGDILTGLAGNPVDINKDTIKTTADKLKGLNPFRKK